MPQRVEIHTEAARILNSDAAGSQIASEHLRARQATREDSARRMHALGFFDVERVNELGQERDDICSLGLGGFCPQFNERLWRIEAKIAPEQLLHFSTTKAGAPGKKIAQGSFTTAGHERVKFSSGKCPPPECFLLG